MKAANDQVPVFPAEGSFEWHWLQYQINVVGPAEERRWDLEADIEHEARLAGDPDEWERWPWYADRPYEICEPEIIEP